MMVGFERSRCYHIVDEWAVSNKVVRRCVTVPRLPVISIPNYAGRIF